MNVKLEQKVKVVVSHNLAATMAEIMTTQNYKKPMVAMDKFLRNSPLVQAMLDKLQQMGLSYYMYDKVVSDPPLSVVNDGAALFAENGCDCIIGMGGGSAIDTARGINIVRTYGGQIQQYALEKAVPGPCPGLIAVPTTSGTGSEMSNALIVTDTETQEKLAVLSNDAVSEFAILHPELLVTLPKGMTAATGLDAFAHAAEGYTSSLSSPVCDAICEKVMYLIVKYLPKAVANGDDLEARERMMVAAALAGWMLNNSGTHLGHSQAHIIGSKFHMPHGAACAYALPGTLKYTAPYQVKKVKEIGLILGAEYPADPTDLEIGEITAAKFRWFRDEVLGLRPFDSWGITREDVLANANAVANERFAGNAPMPVTVELATSLLREFG